jgi:hypothetical protein
VIEDHRVVAFTPYGREITVSILLEYMKRDHARGLLDEWQLWMNTDPDQVRDVQYAHELAEQYPWISLKTRPEGGEFHRHKQMYTGRFYVYTTDPGAIYLRFDDDIVYVHENAIPALVTQKIRRPHVLGLFPIIWNNAICSWHLQHRDIIPDTFNGVRLVVQDQYCMDPIGWADADFAIGIHNLLLDKIRQDDVPSLFMYQDVPLRPQQQFSVSCFAVAGRDYAALTPPGVLDHYEEEHWLTVHRPQVVGKTNVILSDALVSHFSFYPQRNRLLQTDLLDRYRAVSQAVNA